MNLILPSLNRVPWPLLRLQMLSSLLGVAMAASAFGHGVPIEIDLVDGRLVVIGGTPDTEGFVSQLFFDDAPDGALDRVFSPVLGSIAVTDRPGFNIYGVEPGSGIFLESFPRPVADAEPAESRLLWFWNHLNEQVEPTPNLDSLRLISELGSSTLEQISDVAPQPLQIAEPRSNELGQHVHYLRYILDDEPPATPGAYGFFARVTSSAYEPSDPFLIVLNLGMNETLLDSAARAINAAAIDPVVTPLPGDFNGDGDIALDDYELWKQNFGAMVPPFTSGDGNGNGLVDAADYTVWRDSFSRPPVGTSVVPEPTTALLATGCAGIALLAFRSTLGKRC